MESVFYSYHSFYHIFLTINIASVSSGALNLHDNNLAGPLSTKIGLLTKLGKLDHSLRIHSPQMTSDTTVFNHLEQLSLYGNGFTGEIPSELGLLSSIGTSPIGSSQQNDSVCLVRPVSHHSPSPLQNTFC